MIVVKLIGGLGNQLFQYALAKHLAHVNNTEMLLDATAFEDNYKLHKFSLQHFDISSKVADRKVLENIYNYPYSLKKTQRIWEHKVLGKNLFNLNENQFNYQPDIIKKYNGHVVLNGYWQTEKYFLPIQDYIRQEFKVVTTQEPKDIEVSENVLSSENAVSLHIRRADYTNPEVLKVHGVCSLEYYQKGVSFIANKVSNPTFFIFSDDIPWAKKNLKLNYQMIFVEHNNADKNYEDMNLMSQCKHNIIANSSFSWWGAWLNKNPDKIVIAPQKWFSSSERNYSDVVPEAWIKL